MKFVLVFICVFLAAGATSEVQTLVYNNATTEAQFPFHVSLRLLGVYRCGGSILDETTILSAAHCVIGKNESTMTVVAGSTKLTTGGQVYKVAALRPHPNYIAGEIREINDISIVKLAEPITFSKTVQPIKIRKDPIGTNETSVLIGWGASFVNESVPNDLRWMTLKTITNEDCQSMFTEHEIFEAEVCTFTKVGEGSCYGFSGGPLIDDNKEQIGIGSWGIPCAVGKPDVFTRLTSFADWIEANRH